MEQERYYNYMVRKMKEEDTKQGKQNALENAKRMIWVTFLKKAYTNIQRHLMIHWQQVTNMMCRIFRLSHRHIFLQVGIIVTHNDRDISIYPNLKDGWRSYTQTKR